MPKPGSKRELSKTFANNRQIQKIIEKDYVLGYAVIGNARGGSAKVWPIYRGDLHIRIREHGKQKAMNHIYSTYEQGEALNGHLYEDPIGAQLAMIASTAIAALEELKRSRDYAKATSKRARKPKVD